MRLKSVLTFMQVFYLMLILLPTSCSGEESVRLPADVVVMIVDHEMEEVKRLKKAPTCLTVDRTEAPTDVLERLRKRHPGLERSGLCWRKQKGIDIILGTLASSSNEVEVLVKVGDPRIPEGVHVAVLLWEHKYRFERDSDGIWTLVSKTKTCCDIE